MAVAVSVVKGQLTHPIPPHCPHGLATILQSCWKFKPEERPTFEQILSQLKPVAKSHGVDQ